MRLALLLLSLAAGPLAAQGCPAPPDHSDRIDRVQFHRGDELWY